MADKPHAVVWRGDVIEAWLDPPICTAIPLAYIPELHASRKCERALKGGHPQRDPDPAAPWCDSCTTSIPDQATHRRNENGRWRRAA